MSYQFKPNWLTSSLFLTVILGCIGFGLWQKNHESQAGLPSLPLLEPHQSMETLSLNMPFESLLPLQSALATGHYRARNSILLDNINYQGQPGYYLLTPFEILASRAVILVNRGWLPKTPSGQLPDFKTPEGLITLSGVLSHPEPKPLHLEASNPLSVTPPLWYYLDLNFFAQINGFSVLPMMLKLNPDGQTDTFSSMPIPKAESEMTLIRDWQTDSELNWYQSSALQWFLFAVFSLLVFIFTSLKRISGA